LDVVRPQEVEMLTTQEYLIYSMLSLGTGKDLIKQARAVRGRLFWSESKMEEFRIRRCREILVHAGSRVPYYRQLFDTCDFNPARFSSWEELQALPVLTRQALMSSFSSLQDAHAKPSELSRVSTGGTTGNPVQVLVDKHNWVERMLVNHRMYAQMARNLGEPTLMIAGSPIDFQVWNSCRDWVKNRLFNITVRSSFGLTPVATKRLVDELNTGRYHFVIAYASVFDLLASYSERVGKRIALPNIIPCAELVTEMQRRRWRESFGAEIFEIYGSREMSSMAGETLNHKALLINGDIYHVEIADSLGRRLPHGEPGIITVTSLLERGMPLIRYQLGDVGIMLDSSPEDQFPFPWLKITHGRILDIICCPDGKLLPGEFFPHLMKEVSDTVEKFQVVQTDVDQLMVKIVRREGYSEETTRYLYAKMREQLGIAMKIEFRFVDEIETSASGKYRPTMSLVPQERKVFGRTENPAKRVL